MALELIGEKWGTQVLDIHAGGVDLIFPHHEDEIAQSCAYTGQDRFARVWMHGEFLNVRGTKMSKRFGNITTPRDLREDGVDAGAIRLLMFQTHYRQKLDLTDEALAGAQEASRRLGEFQGRLTQHRASADSPRFRTAAESLDQQLTEALDDDLNAPRAMAALFGYMNEGHAALDAGEKPGPMALGAWERAEGVLGVTSAVEVLKIAGSGAVGSGREPSRARPSGPVLETPPEDQSEDSQRAWATEWAVRRKDAKAQRNYPEADRIRALLRQAGWDVRDAKDGSMEVVRVRRAS